MQKKPHPFRNERPSAPLPPLLISLFSSPLLLTVEIQSPAYRLRGSGSAWHFIPSCLHRSFHSVPNTLGPLFPPPLDLLPCLCKIETNHVKVPAELFSTLGLISPIFFLTPQFCPPEWNFPGAMTPSMEGSYPPSYYPIYGVYGSVILS